MKLKILFSIFLLFVLTSCLKQVPLQIKDAPKKLVPICFFTENKTWEVHLRHTHRAGDTTETFVENATVEIYEGSNLYEKLSYTQNGIYVGNTSPKAGFLYEIRIQAENYPSITASDSIPEKIKIKDAYYTLGKKYDISPSPLGQIYIIWQDPKENNYYQVSTENNGYTITAQLSHSLDLPNDSYVSYFSDNYFNGRLFQYEAEKVLSEQEVFYGLISGFPQKVYLQSISKSYFLFKKTVEIQSRNQVSGFEQTIAPYPGYILQFLSTSEPSNVYSNVENGFGIFAGYAQDSTEAYLVK